MTRSVLSSVVTLSLLAGANSSAAAQQDRLGADATTTPVGVHTHIGRRISYVCPTVTSAQIASVEVWGTDIYSSDSPICIAAIHAGVLQAGRPGLVTILVASGADAFTGSARNGVTTKSYGPNSTSYTFDRTEAAGQIDWSTTALSIPEAFAGPILLRCPGGGAMTFQIYGSDVYNEESSICTAAVHAGLFTRANGGNVFVRRDSGLKNYDAVDRNGVKSTAWSGGTASFTVSATPYAATLTAGGGTSSSPRLISAVCSPTVTKPGNAPSSISAGGSPASPMGAVLTWTGVVDAVGYVIERGLASGGTPVKLATTCEHPELFSRKTDDNNVVTMRFLDRSGTVQETAYVYVVRAFGASGEMGWNSTHWTSPTLPLLRLLPVDATGSTVNLHWGVDSPKLPVLPPTDFLVTSDYGYSKVLLRSEFGTWCGCAHTILGVPLGAHTFTVEARWGPGLTSADSKPATIAP